MLLSGKFVFYPFIYEQDCRYTEKVKFRSQNKLQNKNHTEDWVLSIHIRDNGHVTQT